MSIRKANFLIFMRTISVVVVVVVVLEGSMSGPSDETENPRSGVLQVCARLRTHDRGKTLPWQNSV